MLPLFLTLAALAWIVHRVSRILSIPIPTLVKLIGFDIPLPPKVSLDAVTKDSITLHWLPEKGGSVTKHVISMNGQPVGESEKRETSVTVTGLTPGQGYAVRIVAANAQNFQTPGEVIRVRTRRASYSDGTALENGHPTTTTEDPEIHAHTHPRTPPIDAVSSPLNRRGLLSNRRSVSASSVDPASANTPPPEPATTETIESLTAQLEQIRRETTELEAQIQHVEEEHVAAEAVLLAELEGLREKKKEEDVARGQLRTETKTLEESKRSVEAHKTRAERALRGEEESVRKLKNEMRRWKEEIETTKQRVEKMRAQTAEEDVQTESRIIALQSEIAQTHGDIANLDAHIRDFSAQLKDLEAQYSLLAASLPEAEAREQELDEHEERAWNDRQRLLERRYVEVFHQYSRAEEEWKRAQEAVSLANGNGLNGGGVRRSGSPASPVTTDFEAGRAKRKGGRRRNRGNGNLVGNGAAKLGYYGDGGNGMGMNGSGYGRHPPMSGYPDDEAASENGASAPLSPSLSALLPSNLFGQEDFPPSSTPSFYDIMRGVSSHNGGGVGAVTGASGSPVSSSSGTPLSSPSISNQRLVSPLVPPGLGLGHAPAAGTGAVERTANFSPPPPPVNAQVDRHISPVSTLNGIPLSPANDTVAGKIGSRRFGGFFGHSHQKQAPVVGVSDMKRGNTLPPIEPPALGTLSQKHTRSLPKSDLAPIGTRPRSGSAASQTSGPLMGISAGNSPAAVGERRGSTVGLGGERRPFDAFFDPLSPSQLLQPGSAIGMDRWSTSSLPRPSMDGSSFGWPVTGADAGVLGKSPELTSSVFNPLDTTWSMNPARSPALGGVSMHNSPIVSSAAVSTSPSASPVGSSATSTHLNPDARPFQSSLPGLGEKDSSPRASAFGSVAGKKARFSFSRRGSSRFNPFGSLKDGIFGYRVAVEEHDVDVDVEKGEELEGAPAIDIDDKDHGYSARDSA
ncbi:hypothetical protein YB2330_005156 [Saitoella coloradoensis]